MERLKQIKTILFDKKNGIKVGLLFLILVMLLKRWQVLGFCSGLLGIYFPGKLFAESLENTNFKTAAKAIITVALIASSLYYFYYPIMKIIYPNP
jgi:hypothetical protein